MLEEVEAHEFRCEAQSIYLRAFPVGDVLMLNTSLHVSVRVPKFPIPDRALSHH